MTRDFKFLVPALLACLLRLQRRSLYSIETNTATCGVFYSIYILEVNKNYIPQKYQAVHPENLDQNSTQIITQLNYM